MYAGHAAALVAYPWDWTPEEGLALDYARRLVDDPGSLYRRSAVPFPAAYTPLLPALLAPFTPGAVRPLLVARLLAFAWTAAIAAAAYALTRRRAGGTMSLLAAALVLAPLDLTFWYMLVRVDGPMVAFWMWAAVCLLPQELRRGSERLSAARLAVGATLLLAAVLVKPTAVLHGSPLVLGWLLVDARSAGRLALLVAGLGLACLAVLEAVTGGGFTWSMRLWGAHPLLWSVLIESVLLLLIGSAPVLLWALTAGLVGRGRQPRDGALLLLAGGLAVLPALTKHGAWWNYLLPALCAAVVLAARTWALARPRLGYALGALVAVGTVATHRFPLPSVADEATARAFYGFVQERGRPLLATRPDYAYYVLGQPVEVEGSSLAALVGAGVAGTDDVLRRLTNAEYALVVYVDIHWPTDPRWTSALWNKYTPVAYCNLGYFWGPSTYWLLTPTARLSDMTVPPGARCRTRSPS